jgi:diguanylate cyclase (GGDEF)-like protein
MDIAGGIVAFSCSLFLLFNWWQDRQNAALFWWGLADYGVGTGVTLLAFNPLLPDYASAFIAPLIFQACASLTWTAAHIFNRGSIKPRPVIALTGFGIFVFIAVNAYSPTLATAFSISLKGLLFAAAAVEFWLSREERLRGRWLMIGLLLLYSFTIFALLTHMSSKIVALPQSPLGWFASVHFVALLFEVASATCLFSMVKERSEAKHKTAALTDPLTGIANRRAFMAFAERAFGRGGRDKNPISLLIFDLDHFKTINDTFGHASGDRALQVFADVLSRVLRPSDFAGRIGGEEFAVVLPGCGIEAAFAIANRVRTAFQGDAYFLDGQHIAATVSVGVASTSDQARSLHEIIVSADAALYEAKSLGRNRVTIADGNMSASKNPVVRIA